MLRNEAPIEVNEIEFKETPLAKTEIEAKKSPTLKPVDFDEYDSRPALVQHIALHGGLKQYEHNKKISSESIIRGLLDLGETEKVAKSTAKKVTALAFLKGLGTSFTAEEALALSHPARHTAVFDSNGKVVKSVLKQLNDYAEKDADGTLIVTVSNLDKFRKTRFLINQEGEKSSCCMRLFAKTASDGEFDSLRRLYSIRKTNIHGQEEECYTLDALKDIYERPYKAGNEVIDRVAKKRAAESANTVSPLESASSKQIRR